MSTLSSRFGEARHALLRAWHHTPTWARSITALGIVCVVLAAAFLSALALVVNGEVQRSEERQRNDAEQTSSLWSCAVLPHHARSSDCRLRMAAVHLLPRPHDATTSVARQTDAPVEAVALLQLANVKP